MGKHDTNDEVEPPFKFNYPEDEMPWQNSKKVDNEATIRRENPPLNNFFQIRFLIDSSLNRKKFCLIGKKL